MKQLKSVLVTTALMTPAAAMAHSGHHEANVFSNMLHSVTNIDHLWVALPTAAVLAAVVSWKLAKQKSK